MFDAPDFGKRVVLSAQLSSSNHLPSFSSLLMLHLYVARCAMVLCFKFRIPKVVIKTIKSKRGKQLRRRKICDRYEPVNIPCFKMPSEY